MYDFDEISRVSVEYDGGYLYAIVKGTDMGGYEMEEEYRTGPQGLGLWRYMGRGGWKQILGLSQFSASSPRQMRRKLRRMLEQPF